MRYQVLIGHGARISELNILLKAHVMKAKLFVMFEVLHLISRSVTDDTMLVHNIYSNILVNIQ